MHNLKQLLICWLFCPSCSRGAHFITFKVTALCIVRGNRISHYIWITNYISEPSFTWGPIWDQFYLSCSVYLQLPLANFGFQNLSMWACPTPSPPICVLSFLKKAWDSWKFLPLNLGTHEVQACEVNSCATPGGVNISCNFTENSKAKGYLSILYPRNNSSLEMFVVASRTDLSSSKLNVSVSGIPPNDYTVIVYDLKSDGLPPMLSGGTNYPAEEENVTVANPGGYESKYNNFARRLH